MIRILLFSIIVVGFSLPEFGFAEEEYPLREAVECHPRDGLPNFRSKIKAGESVKIAYLGGSITAAGGWRIQSREWFQKQYPDAAFEEIHAAIGGTGSDLGVFRLQNDVLRHEPDLLFVEFAVNDGGAAPERIHKAMEGIVRQTWKSDPTVDICFVYTVSLPVMPHLREGKMQRSASAMEELADHYHIPSIHFGIEVAKLEKSGKLVFKAPKPENIATAEPLVFSTDGVHPHVETGHRLYTEAIARSWPAISEASGKPEPHTAGEPLRADNWEAAKQVAITEDMLKGDWEKLPAEHTLAKRFSRNMPVLYQAKTAGSSLEFSFTGITASVFDLVGPDGGKLKIEVDDSKPVTRNRIDGYCTYHRMSKVAIASGVKDTEHKIRVTLMDEKLDKREILFERNRAKLDSNPELYAPHTWYAGSLLIIGDIVK
ncbi:MAG: GDSL-type esterase/lipase family protein [Verrucomicrobiales bacterium]|nr:GDSL-type esterase/lipase family protein [Verrucomicrobiales bacterium]